MRNLRDEFQKMLSKTSGLLQYDLYVAEFHAAYVIRCFNPREQSVSTIQINCNPKSTSTQTIDIIAKFINFHERLVNSPLYQELK